MKKCVLCAAQWLPNIADAVAISEAFDIGLMTGFSLALDIEGKDIMPEMSLCDFHRQGIHDARIALRVAWEQVFDWTSAEPHRRQRQEPDK